METLPNQKQRVCVSHHPGYEINIFSTIKLTLACFIVIAERIFVRLFLLLARVPVGMSHKSFW
jgi:hypothetical protein